MQSGTTRCNGIDVVQILFSEAIGFLRVRFRQIKHRFAMLGDYSYTIKYLKTVIN